MVIMAEYRNTLQIMADVLETTQDAGRDGIAVTRLLSKSNLSHSRLKGFVIRLTSVGLINEIVYDGKSTFVCTAKGKLYLEEYRKFDDMARSFGLEL